MEWCDNLPFCAVSAPTTTPHVSTLRVVCETAAHPNAESVPRNQGPLRLGESGATFGDWPAWPLFVQSSVVSVVFAWRIITKLLICFQLIIHSHWFQIILFGPQCIVA